MKPFNIIRLSILILFPLVLGMGCGTVKSAYRASAGVAKSVTELVIPGNGEEDGLRKRVLVASLMNQAGIKEEEARRITGSFVELLRKDSDLLVNMLYDVDTPDSDLSSPRYGVVIDPELVKKADVMGMDMLITTSLDPFNVSVKKSGIWPFRKMKKLVDISISMSLIDITYGTLLMADTKTKRIKTDYDEEEGQENRWDVDYAILKKKALSMLKDYSSEIRDRISSQNWTGKIMLLPDKTVIISGGKDVGVTEGSILEVFDKGELIKSFEDKDFFYLGPKVAEVRANEVMESYTIVAPVNSETLVDGQLVRLKR